jgi:recombination associated protein RdgC
MNFCPSNLILFQFDADAVDLSQFAEQASEFPLTEPGPLELERVGFVPLSERDEKKLAVRAGNYTAFAVGIKTKVVPGSVVRERVRVELRKAIENGEPSSGRLRKRIRENVMDELLARAFCKLTVVRGWVDHRGWLLVDTGSANAAELVVSTLRKAIGSMPATRPVSEALGVVFSEWVKSGEADPGSPDSASFGLGDSCTLVTPGGGPRWTGRDVDLLGMEVKEHLGAGARFERMGLTFGGMFSLTLDVNCVVRQLRVMDQMEEPSSDDEDEIDEDAMLVLPAQNVEGLVDGLGRILAFDRAA